MPFEVAEEYKKINTPEFEERRKQVAWMMDCLYIHTMIYGVAPASVVMRMYRKRPGYRLKQSEFMSLFQDIPEEDNPCVVYGDKVKEWLAGIWQWSTQGYSAQEIEKQFRVDGLVFGDKKKRKEFLDLPKPRSIPGACCIGGTGRGSAAS